MTAGFHAGAAIAIAVAAFVIHAPAASAQQGGPPPQQSRSPTLGPDMMHPQSPSQLYPSAPAEIQQVAGRILDMRQVPIRGVRVSNTLVLIGTRQGNKAVVDLGDRLQNLDLRPGQLLEARGRVAEIENRRTILLADAVRYGGLTYDVNRVAFLRRPEPAPAVAAKPSAAAPAAESAAARPAEGKPAGAASSASTAAPTEAKPAGRANSSSTGTTATSSGTAAGAGKTDTGGAGAGSPSTSDGAAKPGQ